MARLSVVPTVRRDSRKTTDTIRESTQPIDHIRLGEVDYRDTWAKQTEAAHRRADRTDGDEIWSLTHPSVYTAGRQTQDSDRPTNGFDVVDIDRGGRITWHGPGQIVCYPIVKLGMPIDVVAYVRRLEEAIIATCAHFGVMNAGRVDGRTGVWLPAEGVFKPERKIAAIGIRVTHKVTMHGIALNCNNTLAYYDHIVPCGINDASVTTLSNEVGHDIGVEDVRDLLVDNICKALDGDLPVSTHHIAHHPSPVKHGDDQQ